MARAGVGVSVNNHSHQAAAEAARAALVQAGLARADAVLCFSTSDHYLQAEDLLSTLQEVCDTEAVVGASGAGVLNGKTEIEGASGLVVMVLASELVSFQPVLVSDVDELGEWWSLRMADVAEEPSLFVCLPDTYSIAPEELLAAMDEVAPGLPVVGGGSVDDGSGERSFQFGPPGVKRGAVAGMIISGVDASVGVTQACVPLSDPLIITRSEGFVVEELGGRPALEVMSEVVRGLDLRAGVFAGLSCVDSQTFGPGEYMVRPITAYDPLKKRFSVASKVTEGQSLVFAHREPRSARQDMERLLSDQWKALSGRRAPAFGLYFNCTGRGRGLYGQTGVDTALIRAHLGAFPLAGLFTGMELAPAAGRNRLQLFSGVLVLVRALS